MRLKAILLSLIVVLLFSGAASAVLVDLSVEGDSNVNIYVNGAYYDTIKQEHFIHADFPEGTEIRIKIPLSLLAPGWIFDKICIDAACYNWVEMSDYFFVVHPDTTYYKVIFVPLPTNTITNVHGNFPSMDATQQSYNLFWTQSMDSDIYIYLDGYEQHLEYYTAGSHFYTLYYVLPYGSHSFCINNVCTTGVNVQPTTTATPTATNTPSSTVTTTPNVTATPNITTTPTALPTPNTTINYNIGALINNLNLDVHVCAGINRGYFYMLTPMNSTKYATYVNEYSCTDFSLPLSDMITSGGSGIWTLSIFDESDLSQSKSMFQVNISENVTLLFTSNPSGAKVYINGSLKGTTPFNYMPGSQTDFHFKFNKSGYYDAIFDARYTLSNTVNANLVPLPSNTPHPTTNPATTPITENPFKKSANSIWYLINDFTVGLGEGIMTIASFFIIGGCAWMGSDKKGKGPGAILAIIAFVGVSALGWLPIIWVIVGVILLIAMFYLGGKRDDRH